MELNNELSIAWNEAEELVTSFNELNDEDLIKCKQALITRAEVIRDILAKYVQEEK